MNKYEYIAQLFHKSKNKTLSRKEKKDLKKWLAKYPEIREIHDRLVQQHALEKLRQYEINNPAKSKNFFINAFEDRDESVEPSGKHISLLKAAAWCALAAAVAAGVIFIVISRSAVDNKLPDVNNKVVLHLDDGTQISPDTVKGYLLINQGDYQILIHKNEIRYMVLPDKTDEKQQDAFNVVKLPPGKLFPVVLPDSSKVILNAVSSIRFPVSNAGGNIRNLELSGEGYFEVHSVFNDKGKIPFVVRAKTPAGFSQDITVTGTTFNINAYGADSVIKTTLIEGSVSVACNGKIFHLYAGEELVAGNMSNCITKNVELKNTIAWKNGRFSFNNATLQQALDEVGRWYGVQMELQDDFPKRISLVQISRLSGLDAILSTISDVVGCECLRVGNRVIVRKRR